MVIGGCMIFLYIYAFIRKNEDDPVVPIIKILLSVQCAFSLFFFILKKFLIEKNMKKYLTTMFWAKLENTFCWIRQSFSTLMF